MKKTVVIVILSLLVMMWRYADGREQVEDTISKMTQEQYDSARKALGDDASAADIARYYKEEMENGEK